MNAALPDVNVLLALAWPSHEHHEAAHAWLRGRGAAPLATCSLTQLGFVRLSANPAVVDPAATPALAAELLCRLLASRTHVFWADDLDAARVSDWMPAWVQGHRQVTDGHLARLAGRHGGRVATFDGGLAAAAGDKLAELIPAPAAGRS